MASDATTQAEVDRLAKKRAVPPNEATLEEENPVESPGNDPAKTDQKRAASSDGPRQPAAKSTEGLTIGGSQETPTESGDE